MASTISLVIVSLGSLSGLITMPIAKKKWFPYVLVTMMSVAVAVMIGDGVVHLFPHSLGLGHDHGHEDGGGNHTSTHGGEKEEEDKMEEKSYIWKCMLVLLGVYIFCMFELFMRAIGGGHSHDQDLHYSNENAISNTDIRNSNSTFKISTSNQKTGLNPKKFQSIVWMILLGDGIHNFLDGVAVGVAYSEKWPSGYLGGISTSIAIFVHEVPHELGDFAVLLNFGLSIKQALFVNFISSLTAILGGFLGVALGTEWEALPWIFAITAGLFIYIALVNMLPEVLHSKVFHQRPFLTIFLANLGLLTGFFVIFLLGAYEDKLKKALS